MYVAGSNTAVEQRKPLPLAQLVHDIRRDVCQVVQAVAGGLQLLHRMHGRFFRTQNGGPLVDDGLHLKHAVDAGGVFQHGGIAFLAGDDAAIQILPLLAAKGQLVHNFLGALIHKVIHQEILGIELHDHAAEIKNNIFIHKTLRKREVLIPYLVSKYISIP